jgi:hypothetical protein
LDELEEVPYRDPDLNELSMEYVKNCAAMDAIYL